MKNTFAIDEAAALTGVTAVQIGHLVRQEAITPAEEAPRRGMSRKFSAAQLVEIVIAAELIRSGFEIVTYLQVLAKFRRDRRTKPDANLLILWAPGPQICGGPEDQKDDRVYLPKLATWDTLQNHIIHGDVIGFCMDVKQVFAAIERATGERL